MRYAGTPTIDGVRYNPKALTVKGPAVRITPVGTRRV